MEEVKDISAGADTDNEDSGDDEGDNIIEELKEKAKEKFSEEEIQKFIQMGKVLCSKSVLSAVICIIMEGPTKGKDPRIAKKLKTKIEAAMPYTYCGYTQVGFHEFEFKLNICLSLVDLGYKTEIDIPHEGYAKDLFAQYDFLKKTAQAYWRQFAEEHKKLYRQICEYRSDVDFSQLVIDSGNITTMYFDPECKKRVGIFAYYCDANNQPYYKKKTVK